MLRILVQLNGITNCILRVAALLYKNQFSHVVLSDDEDDDGDGPFNGIRTTWYVLFLIFGTPALHEKYQMATFVLDFCVITHSFSG